MQLIKLFLVLITKKILLLFGLVFIGNAFIIAFEMKDINIPFPTIIIGALMGVIFFLHSITDTKSNNLEDVTPYRFNFYKFIYVIFITHLISNLMIELFPKLPISSIIINNFDINQVKYIIQILSQKFITIFQIDNSNLPFIQILVVILLSFFFIKNSIFLILE